MWFIYTVTLSRKEMLNFSFVSLKHVTVFIHWDMDVFDVVFEDEPTDFV
jgi:hypothetical protein